MEKLDCVVIGAGVVGLAIARELSLAGREVLIVEAENAFGTHTSARNSEVIHAGLSYPAGSLKARLCVAGKEALYRYCAERGVGHQRIGKLIVATTPDELPGLDKYQQQGLAAGVTDLRPISAAELRALEPEVCGMAALLSPSTGIVDSHGLMLALLGDAQNAGALLALETPVVGGQVTPDGIVLRTGGREPSEVLCRTVVNAAGLWAHRVADAIHGVPRPHPVPVHLADGALQPGYTGIRPRLAGPDSPLHSGAADFVIQGPELHGAPGLVHLLGIESPGLTSSLALGRYVNELLA